MNQIRGDAKVVDTALSTYEKAIFDKFLQKQSAEKAQAQTANDVAHDSLRYLFTIFR
jgi:hypothetical protein